MRAAFWYYGVTAAAVSLLLIAVPATRQHIGFLREDVMLAFAPSAERAFLYGEKHFNGSDEENYDIARAEALFKKAEAVDPRIPDLKHEMARIEFLKGNFDSAMRYINEQIERYGETLPNSYYIRGLIEGYRGEYDASAEDYARYLVHDPYNWAAQNDRAWVLLKGNRPHDAFDATTQGLLSFPENPWLLNTHATALFEIGRIDEARATVARAAKNAMAVSEKDWLTAYPGNDPRIAGTGILTLQDSIAHNMHMIMNAALSR